MPTLSPATTAVPQPNSTRMKVPANSARYFFIFPSVLLSFCAQGARIRISASRITLSRFAKNMSNGGRTGKRYRKLKEMRTECGRMLLTRVKKKLTRHSRYRRIPLLERATGLRRSRLTTSALPRVPAPAAKYPGAAELEMDDAA